MVLSEQLRGAIENGEIQAYFQPLVRARDMRVVGFETLGRWFHPEFGAIPPPEFVKLAEENGLITPLTDLIMRQAIEAAKQWPSDVRVSVNVSPVQINSELVDQVRDIIKESGLDPQRLELEVTEDVLIKDFDQTASMFSRLRALGIQVAMDDFGAGYTSIGNLRRLNFDRLKIDRIFTMDLPNHRRSAAIVRSMFVLARELDLEVTVEGVETYEQFAFLRREGNCELQGYLFSPPKPLPRWAISPACSSARASRSRPPAPRWSTDRAGGRPERRPPLQTGVVRFCTNRAACSHPPLEGEGYRIDHVTVRRSTRARACRASKDGPEVRAAPLWGAWFEARPGRARASTSP